MKKDQSQDKYKELTQKLKDERMNWDFEDFLAETEKQEKIIPLVPKTKGGSFPKIFWMAASVILLLSMGFLFNYKNTIDQKNRLVENEILKQKDSFREESNLAVHLINDSLKIKSDSIISDSTRTVEQISETDIMEQIVPRRGRINRTSRERYAEVSNQKNKENTKAPKYESNYVIINGQKIENEQEAIDLTKYSFRILSENVSKTVAQTDVIKSFNNDY